MAEEMHEMIRATRVVGTEVFDSSGHRLGQVEDLVIDKYDGRVVCAVLSFEGLVARDHHHYPLPWGKLTYDTDRRGYVVDVTREQLQQAPRQAPGEMLDESRREDIFNFWGFAPHAHFAKSPY